ncbi:MAG: YajG family lipoprotein [Methylococcaceae bacterium]
MQRLNLCHHHLRQDAVGHSFILVILFTVALLSGCATREIKTTGGEVADILPKPGATVEVGKITVEGKKQLDFDPAVLLNEALVSALKEEQLLGSGDKTAPRFLFDVKIVDYEPGNAFKRWIIPGWGSTLLNVRGELRTADSGAVAAVIENKRSIFAGGAYTIGAWKSIFGNVADDLVQEMKTRINGGGFVVSLTPYSEQSSGTVRAKNPLELEVKNISDLRIDKLRLGERTAAFGVKMDDIYPNRRVGEYLSETLSDALRTMGHKVGASANSVTIKGELLKFWVETPASALYWDVTAEIELKLLVKEAGQESGTTRVYISKETERTYVWPGTSLIEQVVSSTVANLMNRIQSDNIWNTLTHDSMPKPPQ